MGIELMLNAVNINLIAFNRFLLEPQQVAGHIFAIFVIVVAAAEVAVALANAFNCGVNDLPLSLVLSWFEQKAVAILLTLLHLGVKNIRIGPSAPAFITPNVLKVLQDNYNLKLITTPDQDLKEILG